MKTRIRYHFTGFVQGVGFRYTAFYTAESLGLTGFVRNEEDGSVTAEVQGEETAITEFVKRMNSGKWIRIQRMEAEKADLVSDETSFRIESTY